MESIVIKPCMDFAQTMSSHPEKEYGELPIMRIGKYDANNLDRILIKFSLACIPANAVIVQANLELFMQKQSNTTVVTPYALEGNWTKNSVTWNNMPSYNPAVYGESQTISRSERYTFDMTSIVSAWYNAEMSNFGIVLKGEENYNSTSANVLIDTTPYHEAVIEITYTLKADCTCIVIPTQFIEADEEFNTTDLYYYSTTKNTSLTKTVTYFIKNTGFNNVTANIQITPDEVEFINEQETIIIEPSKIVALIPCTFSKFARVRVKNTSTGETSSVKIWYQSQK